jgi:hypothetical protein
MATTMVVCRLLPCTRRWHMLRMLVEVAAVPVAVWWKIWALQQRLP